MDPPAVMSDPLGIGASLAKIQESWMHNRDELMCRLMKLNSDLQSAGVREFIPLLSGNGMGANGNADDPQAAFLNLVKSYSKLAHRVHAVYGNWLREFVNEARDVEEGDRKRSIFWINQFISGTSPSNYFWTNPVAVQKCLRTKGESLVNGLRNWLEDAGSKDRLTRIADMEAFRVGEDLAATPGFVVYRNELIELIQYAPVTESTRAVPVVFVQPSINKYYILDLNEEKSLVRYLLNKGFTVFMVSWKNPTSEMRDITFDDYMFRGALKAIEAAAEIRGAKDVHAVGFCIGGTVLAALMAWLNREEQEGEGAGMAARPLPVAHWTLFATMVDYSDPGEVGALISEHSIGMIERMMKEDGYLDSRYMALAFRLLRPDSLIWRYHAHNYLQGEMPPKSDFLYWNSDSTRLPAAMGSFYLREFYLRNNLQKEDAVELGGRPIDLRRIAQPLYAVGAVQDHICPWRGTFRICNLVRGPVRYALAEEGHIAGIVNPPSARSRKTYWAADAAGDSTADEWLASNEKRQGSWWVDWVDWLYARCGPLGPPPPMGSENYPPLEKAPGTYVLE